MEVWFGPDLDGCILPPSLQGMGRAVVGPSGLLDLLEARLGSGPGPESPLEQVQAYQAALEQEQEGAFYAESFQQAPLAVAQRLLKWRDDLHLAGWDPTRCEPGVAPERLQTLARVEAHFAVRGVAERLGQILETLATPGIQSGVDRLHLIGDRDLLPKLWQDLLDRLPVQPGNPLRPTKPLAPPGSALAAFQTRLLGLGQGNTESIEPDSTLTLYQADSESTLAAAAVDWLGNQPAESTVVVGDAEHFGPVNQRLELEELPRLPIHTRSPATALLNLVPLALRLQWKPFDPQAWIEFLLHPIHPVSGKLRFSLAAAIHRMPGYQSPKWQKALAKVLEEAGEDEAPKFHDQVRSWLEPGMVDPAGASTEGFAQLVHQLGTWMSRTEDRRPMAKAAFRLEKLLRQGPTCDRLSLERLLAAWLRENAPGEGSSGHVGQPWHVRDPAHLLEPQDHVLAWYPRGFHPPVPPWFPEEREWLRAQDVTFPDPIAVVHAREKASEQTALLARQSLVLFLPPSTEELHERPSGLVLRILAEAGPDIIKNGADSIPKVETPLHPLPEARRWWTLPQPKALQVDRRESYSSLNKWIYSPYQWVFEYAAKLQPGGLVDFRVRDEARRQGALLHGFVESLFDPGPVPALEEDAPVQGIVQILVDRLLASSGREGTTTPDLDWHSVKEEAVSRWVRANWEPLLAEQAAHYLVPGYEASRYRLRHLAEKALWQLILQLQEAGVTRVECERLVEDVDFTGGRLKGYIDLVVQTQDGRWGVLDLKLGGLTSRRAELIRNTHLQLALYGHLIRSVEHSDPHCAYFIFKGNGQLLARNREFFQAATTVYKATDTDQVTDWQGCWNDFETVWTWRHAQLEKGEIEFTTSHTTADANSDPPLSKWRPSQTIDAYNQFDALCGWPRNA